MDFRNILYRSWKIIQQDLLRYITPDTNEVLSTQKLKTFEIRDDMFSFQYFTKSFCLYIQKKINVIEKFCLLVRTLNMNDDDNDGKVCGISTKFIKTFTNFFFVIIGEKASINILLNKKYYLRKMEKLTFLYWPMYLLLDD